MFLHFLLLSFIIGIPIITGYLVYLSVMKEWIGCFIISFMLFFVSSVWSNIVIGVWIYKAFILFPYAISLIIVISIGMLLATFTIKTITKLLHNFVGETDVNMQIVGFLYVYSIIILIFSPVISLMIILTQLLSKIVKYTVFYKIYKETFCKKGEE